MVTGKWSVLQVRGRAYLAQQDHFTRTLCKTRGFPPQLPTKVSSRYTNTLVFILIHKCFALLVFLIIKLTLSLKQIRNGNEISA